MSAAQPLAIFDLCLALLQLFEPVVSVCDAVMNLEHLLLVHVLPMQPNHILADVDERLEKVELRQPVGQLQVPIPIVGGCVVATQISLHLLAVLQHLMNTFARAAVTLLNVLQCFLVLMHLHV